MKRIITPAWIGVTILFSLAGMAHAQTTVDFYLASPGSGANLAGVYTSPYTGSVAGPTGPIIPVICDDFADESYVPEEWTAYVTPLSTLTSSTDTLLKWSGASTATFMVGADTYQGWDLTQAQAYTVAAVLAIDILQSNSTAQEDYSYALWELFDPGTVDSWLGTSYQSTLMASSSEVESAITQVTNSGLTPASFPDVTIYSYDPTGGQAECGSNLNTACSSLPPQEFIIVAPEPPSVLLFGTGLMGIVFVMRKRFFASPQKLQVFHSTR